MTRHAQKNTGFTVLELILVVGLSAVFVALTLPVGVTFYRKTLLDESQHDLISVLRTTEKFSALKKFDRTHGVALFPDRYIRFQGISYANRLTAEDEVFPLPTETRFSGISSEIVFDKGTGIPSTSGTLTMEMYGEIRKITIRPNGLVEYAQ